METERLEFTKWQGYKAVALPGILLKLKHMKSNLLLALLFTVCCSHLELNKSNVDNKYPDRTGQKIVTKNVVRIYPNPSYNGTINVNSSISDVLHFYIFDLDGTMVHQSILKNKQKQTIHNLKKGIYMYDAFRNDVSVEHGKIIVK
jgi:hypothetical protein